jgi:5-methylcytosine-specific restriction endonuclease McrA
MKVCTLCEENKPLTEFRKRANRTGYHVHCKPCQVLYVSNRRREIKKQCLEYKGGCCSKCGYDKSDYALEFHHRDPEKKDFSINRGASLVFDKLKEELDKCDLLCANCHREEHERLTHTLGDSSL